MRNYIFILILFTCFAADSNSRGNNYIALSTAVFDILQQDATSFEGRIEFRLGKIDFMGHPFSGIMFNTEGAVHLFVGLYYDIPLEDFIVITPSFAPGIYANRNSKDLNYALEFRSQIEISYVLSNYSRIGFSFNHISNASLGDENPGVESLALTYTLPF